MPPTPHVIIIGAGPAGAALAYLFARRNISVTLVERQTDFAREFRGEVLMPSGLDAFTQMGLREVVDALPARHIRYVELYRDGAFLVRLDPPQQLGASGPRVVSQPALLEELVAAAGRFSSFRFISGASARDLLRQNGRVVGVQVTTKEGERDVHGDFVIGADGRASLLRKRAGLHEERSPQAFDVVWGKAPMPDGLFAGGDAVRFYISRGHAAVAFPSYDGRLQIGWVIDKGAFGDLRRRGITEWVEEMARYLSPDLGEYLRAHIAAISHPFLLDVVCDRLVRWTAPGLLLLGDAAHPMSPVGGQGINIALRDALVAANHLCPILERAGTAEELDAAAAQVQAERLREVAAIQRLQHFPPSIIFQRSWWSRLILRQLPFFVRIGAARQVVRFFFRRLAAGVTPVRLKV